MAEPTAESAHRVETDEPTERVAPAADKGKRSRRGRLRRMERAEIQTFFDGFLRALIEGQHKAIAEMFDVPAFIVGDDLGRAVLTPEEVQHFFVDASEGYRARGVADSRAELVRLDRITSRLVMVTLRQPWLEAGGRELGEDRASYIIQRAVDGSIRIRVAILRGGRERPPAPAPPAPAPPH